MKSFVAFITLVLALDTQAGVYEQCLYYRFTNCGTAYSAPVQFDLVRGSDGAVSVWWREACNAPVLVDLAASDATAAAWAKAQRADISSSHSVLSSEEKALGLTTITLLNGRLSNLVVVLNQKMGLTGTNRITAASIGGTITPQEASQILKGYLQ